MKRMYYAACQLMLVVLTGCNSSGIVFGAGSGPYVDANKNPRSQAGSFGL